MFPKHQHLPYILAIQMKPWWKVKVYKNLQDYERISKNPKIKKRQKSNNPQHTYFDMRLSCKIINLIGTHWMHNWHNIGRICQISVMQQHWVLWQKKPQQQNRHQKQNNQYCIVNKTYDADLHEYLHKDDRYDRCWTTMNDEWFRARCSCLQQSLSMTLTWDKIIVSVLEKTFNQHNESYKNYLKIDKK